MTFERNNDSGKISDCYRKCLDESLADVLKILRANALWTLLDVL